MSATISKFTKNRTALIATLLVLSTCIAWKFVYDALFLDPARALNGSKAEFTVRALDYTKVYDGTCITPVSIVRAGLDIRADLYVFYRGSNEVPQAFEPGAVISATAKATLASEHASDRSSSGTFLYLYANANDATEVERPEFSVLNIPHYISHGLARIADDVFKSDAAPFMKAILIGDRFDWSADGYVKSAFAIAGLSHVVSVSGMHLGFLTAFVSLILGKGKLRAFLGLPIVALFVLLAGANPPVVRTGVMSAAFMIAPLLERDYKPWRALLVSLTLLYIQNPYSLTGASLQLSYAAVAGILLFSGRFFKTAKQDSTLRDKLLRFLRNTIALSLAANVFTLPLAVYHFGYVSLLFMPANLLTLWAVEVAFIVGAIALLVGAFLPVVGAIIGFVPTILTRYIIAVTTTLSRIPYAAVYVSSAYIVFWLIYILAVAVILVLSGKLINRKLPIFFALTTVSLAAALTFSRFDTPTELSATALNVGQGSCVVFMSPNSSAIVDCGGNLPGDEGDIAADYLAAHGRFSLDALVLTHFHEDHAAGVPELLRRVNVERLIVPSLSEHEYGTLATEIFLIAAQTGTQIEYVSDTTVAPLPGVSLTMFPPLSAEGENERGLTVLAESGSFKAFVCGDMDSTTELRLSEYTCLPDIDVLFVGHHGSRYSSSELFLALVRPETAIISCGVNNTYGHPTDEALQRLSDAGAETFRTDLSGSVEVRVQ